MIGVLRLSTVKALSISICSTTNPIDRNRSIGFPTPTVGCGVARMSSV